MSEGAEVPPMIEKPVVRPLVVPMRQPQTHPEIPINDVSHDRESISGELRELAQREKKQDGVLMPSAGVFVRHEEDDTIFHELRRMGAMLVEALVDLALAIL